MRDSFLSSEQFCRSIESLVRNSSEISDRSSALVSSNLRETSLNSIRISDISVENLIVLGILSWYVDEGIGVLLRLSIQERIRNNSDLTFIGFLLERKGTCLCFLLDSKLWHTRDFFGNILTKRNISKALRSLSILSKTRKRPTRVQRRRGYKDKGTLRENHEIHNLWISTDEQNRLEIERSNRIDTFSFLTGFIE